MSRLDGYRMPLQPAPDAVLAVVKAGLQAGEFPPVTEARSVLAGASPPPDQMLRDSRARVLITCTTAMPGVTPAMLDWWFGWHLPESDRYRLWHPLAHVAARVQQDRTAWPDLRSRYIGNISHVDEYIGKSLKKLSISFKDPAEFGFDSACLADTTVICAETFDRTLKTRGGFLVHHVVPTANGAQMRSAFWLGDAASQARTLGPLLNLLLNTRAARRLVLTEAFVSDLLIHCAEEMNHLSKFLPLLYSVENASGNRLIGDVDPR